MKRLLPYLRNNGIETRIIFFAAHTKNLPTYQYFTKLGFTCKIIYWELFNEEKIIEILNDINRYPPDIFIPNYFPVACYAAKWAKQNGIPTICILHNDNDLHNKLINVFALGDEGYKVSAIIGVSKLLTEMIMNQHPVNVKVECIPYGAPIPEKISVLKTNDTLKLVYMGRMMETQKRISDVTKAFCRVAKEIPGTECVLYGSGKDLPNVLNILKANGKGLPVHYEGILETTVVQAHLMQNHIFVLLSDYEGLPIALMEAMACGLVPVCSNIRSGMTELITQNETGFLVNDRNDDFVNTIKKLKSDYNLWQRLSEAARKKIVEEYSEEICNKRWLNFLKIINADNKVSLPVLLPTIAELKKLYYPPEFNSSSNPMPTSLLVPLYKLKSWAGRVKRNYLNQT
jgi:glycosyltransferase involved in cell wall biosynthesis